MKNMILISTVAALALTSTIISAPWASAEKITTDQLTFTELDRIISTSPRFQDRETQQIYYLDKRNGNFYWEDGSLKFSAK